MEDKDIKESLKEFFLKYKKSYGTNELDNLMYSILNKKNITLSPPLNTISKKQLYKNTINIIIEFFENRNIIVPKSIMYLTKKSLFRTIKQNEKRVASVAIAASLLLSPSIINLTKAKKEIKNIQIEQIHNEASVESDEIIIHAMPDEIIDTSKYDFLNKKVNMDTIDDINKIKDEIVSLNLTEEDKIYKTCPLSAEVQWFILKVSIDRKIPSDFIFAIIDKESGGQFNTSGVTSHQNANGSYDYGLTQQNSKYAIPSFAKKFNLREEDATYLIKNDDYANIIAFCDTIDEKINIINNIRNMNNQEPLNHFDVYLIASNYNGGASPSEFSKQYAREIEEMVNNKYTENTEMNLETQKKKR